MTMTIEEARAVKRPPVTVGERRLFYSTMQQEYEPPAKRLRRHTGQLVTVIARADDLVDACDDEEPEHTFRVIADDGHEFTAYEGELNGWFYDTGQYFNPDATWGPTRETWPLQNERGA